MARQLDADVDALALAARHAADALVADEGVGARDEAELRDDLVDARARASSDVDGGSRGRAANAKVSRTVESAKSASSCSTYAEIMGIFPSHGTPLTSTEPWSLALRVIGTRPASVLRSDVLPLPLGPMIARRLAASSEPETSERISFVCFFCLIVYVTLRHESSAAGFERCSATTVGFSTAAASPRTTVGLGGHGGHREVLAAVRVGRLGQVDGGHGF